MRDVLIEACLEVVRAGGDREDLIRPPYRNHRILTIGNFLLNRFDPSRRYYLRFGRQGARSPQGTQITVCFDGTIAGYFTILEALKKTPLVNVLHVDYGQASCKHERKVVARIEGTIRTIKGEAHDPLHTAFEHDLRQLKKLPKATVKVIYDGVKVADSSLSLDRPLPARNLLLSSIASRHSPVIWLPSFRTRDRALEAENSTLILRETSRLFTDYYGYEIHVRAPLQDLTMRDLIKKYLTHDNGTKEALKATHACWTPPLNGDPITHCGECLGCYERYLLFEEFGIEFPFITHPKETKNWLPYCAQTGRPIATHA